MASAGSVYHGWKGSAKQSIFLNGGPESRAKEKLSPFSPITFHLGSQPLDGTAQ